MSARVASKERRAFAPRATGNWREYECECARRMKRRKYRPHASQDDRRSEERQRFDR
jgi:hypothetical protein